MPTYYMALNLGAFMDSKDKIQHMLISHLLKEGAIDLSLPNNTNLSIGLTKEDKYGFSEICNDYCWVSVCKPQQDRQMFIDDFSVEARFSKGFVVQDDMITEEGDLINFVDVV